MSLERNPIDSNCQLVGDSVPIGTALWWPFIEQKNAKDVKESVVGDFDRMYMIFRVSVPASC